eukprot:1672633-Pyramimonas_sp.AAC.1
MLRWKSNRGTVKSSLEFPSQQGDLSTVGNTRISRHTRALVNYCQQSSLEFPGRHGGDFCIVSTLTNTESQVTAKG